MAQRATRTVLGCLRKLIAEPGIRKRIEPIRSRPSTRSVLEGQLRLRALGF